MKEIKELTIPTIVRDVQTVASNVQEVREKFDCRFDKIDHFMMALMASPLFTSTRALLPDAAEPTMMMVNPNAISHSPHSNEPFLDPSGANWVEQMGNDDTN